jgi:hypothetical protein
MHAYINMRRRRQAKHRPAFAPSVSTFL